MKINWKVRFKNKVWLMSFIGAIITFVYQLLAMFNVVPKISEDTVVQLVGLILNVLVGIGVIQDPTTAGIEDSKQALTYNEPKPKE